MVSLYGDEVQSLSQVVITETQSAKRELTSRISGPVIEPLMSCLLAKIRRDAPAKR